MGWNLSVNYVSSELDSLTDWLRTNERGKDDIKTTKIGYGVSYYFNPLTLPLQFL